MVVETILMMAIFPIRILCPTRHSAARWILSTISSRAYERFKWRYLLIAYHAEILDDSMLDHDYSFTPFLQDENYILQDVIPHKLG